MIIVTSLSPNHSNKENQINAIESWKQYGPCYSMNNGKEREQLESLYNGINFIKTERTLQQLIGKPLVNINAMIDYAKDSYNDLLLINSDIILSSLPDLKEDGITIFSRYDYSESFEDAKMFEAGFDAFFVPYKFLNIFPPTIYGMGNCFWDHSIPYRAIINNIPVYWHLSKNAFHKIHKAQYDYKEWEYMGEFFKLEFKLNKQWPIPKVTTTILPIIKSNLIVIS
jgi:hypothetical protein